MKSRLRHPIRAIREPFGTAGLIVAMIALVAALGGTAFAAAKLNSTQKKEVEKIAKKFAGAPGANGTNGAAGAKGDAGAAGANGTAGTNGTNGTNGKSVVLANGASGCTTNGGAGGTSVEVSGEPATKKFVCNGKEGEPWTAGGTLPQGKTERGDWSFGAMPSSTEFIGEASEKHFTGLASISFGIPLSSAPTATVIQAGQTGQGGCPVGSSVSNPQAEPGNLCIFIGTPTVNLFEPAPGIHFVNPESTDAGGAILDVVAEDGTKGVGARGTWAVTGGP